MRLGIAGAGVFRGEQLLVVEVAHGDTTVIIPTQLSLVMSADSQYTSITFPAAVRRKLGTASSGLPSS